MNAKNNQRTRLTKRLFHESMLHFLQTESADKVTVKELCDQAELNRTTFYLHYTSPEDILLEMETELIQNAQMYLNELKDDAKTISLLEKVFPYLLPKFETKIDKSIRTYVNSYLTSGVFAVVYTWSLNEYVLSVDKVADMVYTLSKAAMKPYVKK